MAAVPRRSLKRCLAIVSAVSSATVPLQARATLLSTTTADKAAASKLTATLTEKFGAGISATHMADIQSYYWWEGAVQDEPEIRLDVTSAIAFADLRAAMEAVHPYDVPMIIAEAGSELLDGQKPAARYVRGTLELPATPGNPAESIAKALVADRLVACAQVEKPSDKQAVRLAVKTLVAQRSRITERAREASGRMVDVKWVPILGNQPYLDWVDENVVPTAAGQAQEL
eukprot:TRINITY_DN113932_c0_g1_i1.p1 TRINITY_DN113932_c0_g1~~TRINITY_DN113932_c0_g1_i1.p1  ORF type:complete len:251 (-),score=48.55 TRINITY_DN113932_c0_g1_i1:153-839(-)